MTLRDYVRRRLRVGLAIAFTVGVIAANLLNVFAGHLPYRALFVIAVVLGPFAVMYCTIRCPMCSARLPRAIANRIDWTLLSRKIQHCPYCGVNLDEPMLNERVTRDAKMSKRFSRSRQALMTFLVGLILLAAGSRIMPDQVYPTTKLRTVSFLVVGGAGLVSVVAGLGLAVRALVFRSRT